MSMRRTFTLPNDLPLTLGAPLTKAAAARVTPAPPFMVYAGDKVLSTPRTAAEISTECEPWFEIVREVCTPPWTQPQNYGGAPAADVKSSFDEVKRLVHEYQGEFGTPAAKEMIQSFGFPGAKEMIQSFGFVKVRDIPSSHHAEFITYVEQATIAKRLAKFTKPGGN